MENQIEKVAAKLPAATSDPISTLRPEYVAWAQSEGVRDQDFTWYGSQRTFTRACWIELGDLDRGALLWSLCRQGMSSEAALSRVWMAHPNFGDEQAVMPESSDDQPLPWELKDRIDREIERRRGWVASSGTFNAMVRTAIAEGSI